MEREWNMRGNPMYFGPACNMDLSRVINTAKDGSTLQMALPAPLNDTSSLQLSLFWRLRFWLKGA
jgi:hypothetical protein